MCRLPQATYAVFSAPPCAAEEFSGVIRGAWDYIFGAWFPASGFEYAPGCVDFKLCDGRCMSDAGKVCDTHVPVSRRKKQTEADHA